MLWKSYVITWIKNDNYVDENEVDKDIMLMYCKHI